MKITLKLDNANLVEGIRYALLSFLDNESDKGTLETEMVYAADRLVETVVAGSTIGLTAIDLATILHVTECWGQDAVAEESGVDTVNAAAAYQMLAAQLDVSLNLGGGDGEEPDVDEIIRESGCVLCWRHDCECPAEAKEAARLVRAAMDCPHGEIFEGAMCDSGDQPRGLVEVTNEILSENAEEPQDEGSPWHGVWVESVEDEAQAVEVWKAYFTNYPTHGEYAGLVCSLLADANRWQDIVEVLTACQGDEAFGCWIGWDS